VAEQLARDAREILAQPEVTKRLTAQGMSAQTNTPAEFNAAIGAETKQWAEIIKARKIEAQ